MGCCLAALEVRGSREALSKLPKTVIHVNQHVIRRNKRDGCADPPITVRRGAKVTRAAQVVIYGQDAKPAAIVKYSPDKPLSCGARVWIELLTEAHVLELQALRSPIDVE